MRRVLVVLIALTVLGSFALYNLGVRSVTVIRGDTPAAGEIIEPMWSRASKPLRLDENGTIELPWDVPGATKHFNFDDGTGLTHVLKFPPKGQRVYRILDDSITTDDTFDMSFGLGLFGSSRHSKQQQL